jgi:hypothetical protein
LASILLYHGTTVLHFLLGAAGLRVGYAFSGWIGHSLSFFYLAFAFSSMYLLLPLKVCPHCAYYRLKNSRCISALNLLSRKMVKEGKLEDFPKRSLGWACPNNLYLASLVFPIVAMVPVLIIQPSTLVWVIFASLISLLAFRFLIIFPVLACLHCCAKYMCPQAKSMGVRDR